MFNVFLLTAALGAAGKPVPDLQLPQMDVVEALAVERVRLERGEAPRYAITHKVQPVALTRGHADDGQWEQLADGRWQWTLQIEAPGATSVDVGFDDYWLPQGAELSFSDTSGTVTHGPYTDRHNRPHRQLWTPVVPGESALVQLIVDADMRDHVSLRLSQVNQGFRFFNEPMVAKSLSCNVDVACPEADPYADEVRAAALYGVGSSGGICSGSLINNTAQDATPYFLSANHCSISASTAPSVVFYFNYQSDTCRTGSESGTRLPLSIADTVSGATLIANNRASDFLLLRMNELPPGDFDVHYTGWDRRDVSPSMGAAVHHPAADEKRIAVEFDPVVDSAETVRFGGVDLAPFTYWEVLEWDVGITEGGSSGSPLLNEDMRIVGQLAGGATFVCPGAEEGSDVFGKMSVSWDAGETPQQRLSDWLDPLGTDAEVLGGAEGCTAPTVALSVPAAVDAGQLLTPVATVSGGQPPYTYEWHIDADPAADSFLASPVFSWPEGGRFDVMLRVADSTGCPAEASRALVVREPVIELTAVASPIESCGDGDELIERGESWSFPVTFTNTGSATALDAVAGFAVSGKSGTTAKRVGGPDGFGYRFHDSTEAFCSYQPIDVVSEENRLSPTEPDDGVVIADLGGPTFRLYDQSVNSMAVSTNGYLSTDTADNGEDFSNDCPLPRVPSAGGGARLMPLHDDFVVRDGLYHQYFEDCPRPADVANAGPGCNVFHWEDADLFDTDEDTEAIDFQAVLYDNGDEVVYQYPALGPQRGPFYTTAIQNAVADAALTYACNTPDSVPDQGAVCYYHPEAAPPEKAGDVVMETPAIPLGNLAVGRSVQALVTVRIEQDFPCGSFFGIDYLGSGYQGGFSVPPEGTAMSAIVAGGNCDSAGTCNAVGGPEPRRGFWFDALRPGNGMDLHFVNGVYGAWYTGTEAREPVWYYLQTLDARPLAGGQVRASILRFTGPVGVLGMPPTFTVVGQATMGFIDDSSGLMTWELNGERFGQLLTFFDLADAPVDPTITEQWFNVDEPGWGLGMHQQGNQEFTAVYLYDQDDQPSWVVTLDPAQLPTAGDSRVGVFRAHCPSCPWAQTPAVIVGTYRRDFTNADEGVVDLQVEAEAFRLLWQRESLPIVPIRSLIR